MIGSAIALAARQCLGAPFRLHGRDPATGLDCVGLVAWALDRAGQGVMAPADYSLRMADSERVFAFAKAQQWQPLNAYPPRTGSILLLRPSPVQLHLGIVAGAHFIHAHARLRRVVEAPLPPVADIVAAWAVPSSMKG